MNSTTTTQKGETLGQFDDRTEGFKSATHKGFAAGKCTLTGRARQALTLLLRAGAQGLTQAQALIEGNGWRLAATIHVLRRKGFRIATHRQYRPNGSWCARYVLSGFAEGVKQ